MPLSFSTGTSGRGFLKILCKITFFLPLPKSSLVVIFSASGKSLPQHGVSTPKYSAKNATIFRTPSILIINTLDTPKIISNLF